MLEDIINCDFNINTFDNNEKKMFDYLINTHFYNILVFHHNGIHHIEVSVPMFEYFKEYAQKHFGYIDITTFPNYFFNTQIIKNKNFDKYKYKIVFNGEEDL